MKKEYAQKLELGTVESQLNSNDTCTIKLKGKTPKQKDWTNQKTFEITMDMYMIPYTVRKLKEVVLALETRQREQMARYKKCFSTE
jgi:hypothetical protein